MRRRSVIFFKLVTGLGTAALACGRERAPEAKTGAVIPTASDAVVSGDSSDARDARDARDASDASDAASNVTSAAPLPVVHLSLEPLGAAPRTCDVFRDGAVRFGDLFDGVSDAKATPDTVSALVAGLASCGLCALAARPHQGVGKSKRRIVVELHAGGAAECSADLPWELWTSDGKACAKAIEKALTPLQSQCPHCTWP